MKPIHDLFVGLVAVGLGCLLIAGAIAQAPLLMQLSKSRLLAEAVGATAARWVIAVVGIGCVALGTLIACGWRVHW